MIKIIKIEFTTITNFVSKLQFNCQNYQAVKLSRSQSKLQGKYNGSNNLAVDVYEKRRHFQVSAQADGRIEAEEIQGLACGKSHLKRITSF